MKPLVDHSQKNRLTPIKWTIYLIIFPILSNFLCSSFRLCPWPWPCKLQGATGRVHISSTLATIEHGDFVLLMIIEVINIALCNSRCLQ